MRIEIIAIALLIIQKNNMIKVLFVSEIIEESSNNKDNYNNENRVLQEIK